MPVDPRILLYACKRNPLMAAGLQVSISIRFDKDPRPVLAIRICISWRNGTTRVDPESPMKARHEVCTQAWSGMTANTQRGYNSEGSTCWLLSTAAASPVSMSPGGSATIGADLLRFAAPPLPAASD